MTTTYQSESAIERATGMSVDAWLDYNGYGEREATTRTLTNLTEAERVENDREARLANLDRLECLASARMPLFQCGEVNSADIEINANNIDEICDDMIEQLRRF